MKFGYWLLYAVITILTAVFMELNKQTVFGWILYIILLIGFPMIYRKVFLKGRWYQKLAAWAAFLVLFALIVLVSWPPVKAVPAVAVSNPDKTEVIELEDGAVQGVYNADHSVEVYAGIPYAKPPVDELRWKAPRDPEPWDGVRQCDSFAPMSMQETALPIYGSLVRIVGYHEYPITLKDNYRPPVSEDSLHLNVWKPAGDAKKLPVLVYIHGGSLQEGNVWTDTFNGEHFAKDGIVTVNLSYRLGVFGFFADEELLAEEGTTGNYGLLDQIKALEWVRDNIEQFGGDPDNVTICGESAGAVCVDALCASPLAKGLFQRAILESSTISSPIPPHSFRLFEDALASGKDLKARWGCESVEDLRKIPASELVGELVTQHHVTIDGTVLTDLPYNLRKQGLQNETALLHGYNLEESGPFILFEHANLENYESKVRGYFKEYADDILEAYPAETDEEADVYWAEVYGGVFFNYSHDVLQRVMKDQEPVYQYRFSKENGALSSWHSGELIYAFGNIPEKSSVYDASDRNLSDIMHAYWANFVKTGDPNGEGLPEFKAGADTLLDFGAEVKEIENPYQTFFAIMDRMQGYEE